MCNEVLFFEVVFECFCLFVRCCFIYKSCNAALAGVPLKNVCTRYLHKSDQELLF